MRIVVDHRPESLHYLFEDGKDDLRFRVLERSSGSFLWAHRVLRELETACTEESVQDILKQVPNDLNEMYAGIIKSINKDKRRAKLAKSILSWVTLAVRPLTIGELRDAVQLDTGQSLLKMKQAIITACGQLVHIDQGGRVQIVHETAREYLCSKTLDSEFAIDPDEVHGHLAFLCLIYLFDKLEAFGPAGSRATADPKALFINYASECFSHHLARSKARDSMLFAALSDFLDHSTLFWIEHLARRRLLNTTVRAAVDLRVYINAELEQTTSPVKAVEQLKSWAIDLSRVGLAFRESLMKCPSAIHRLVPPFCPEDSMIARRFNRRPTSFTVTGKGDATWQDCIINTEFDVLIETICCGQSHAAVGFSTGLVSMYDTTLFENVGDVTHPGRLVKSLSFGCMDKYLATAGWDDVVIWDRKTTTTLHHFRCPDMLSFCFAGSVFTTLTSTGQMVTRNLETNDTKVSEWTGTAEDIDSFALPLHASKAVFSHANSRRLAITFVGSANIYVFDADLAAFVYLCLQPTATTVQAMAFHPLPKSNILAAAYTDGSLAIFDTEASARLSIHSDVFAKSLSWTSDGRYLAVGTGDAEYTVELYGFADTEKPSLTLVYRVDHPGTPVTPQIVGTQAGRIISAHSHGCRVWEPQVLAHKGLEKHVDAKSQREQGESVLVRPEPSQSLEARNAAISAMALTRHGNAILCGHENGEVTAFVASDCSKLGTIHSCHADKVSMLRLVQDRDSELVVTGDDSGYVVIARREPHAHYWSQSSVILQKKAGSMVTDILVSPSGDSMLVVTMAATELWELPSGRVVNRRRLPAASANLRQAKQCPLQINRFMLLEDSSTYLFLWDGFERAPADELTLTRDGHIPAPEAVTNTKYLSSGRLFVEKLADPSAGVRLNCWDVASFQLSNDSREVAPRKGLQPLNAVIGDVIAVAGVVLVFLDKGQWVCTANLDTFASTGAVERHFFIFPEWVSRLGEVICTLTPRQDLVFASRRSPTVVRGWMCSSETIQVTEVSKCARHSR